MASTDADPGRRTAAELKRAVLDFWFGPREGLSFYSTFPGYRNRWFTSTPEFDKEIAATFGKDIERAAAGEYDELKGDENAEGELVLVVLLDQFTRNVFRGTRQAFAYDEKARAIARSVVEDEERRDKRMMPVMRPFLYMTLMHDEAMEGQLLCKQLLLELSEDYNKAEGEEGEALEADMKMKLWASDLHMDMIRRFGRFPHRNEVLGRQSTPAEIEYLKTGRRWGQ